jgi:hypothetical protein
LSIVNVPILYDGLYENCDFKKLEHSLNFDRDEGYVIRVADSFSYGEFKTSIAKFVRPGHVMTTRHWRAGRSFTPNDLAKD